MFLNTYFNTFQKNKDLKYRCTKRSILKVNKIAFRQFLGKFFKLLAYLKNKRNIKNKSTKSF